MQKVEVTSIVAYSTYGICLVWTAYVILAMVLDLSDGIILQDVDAYFGHLMDNVRILPFHLFSVLFLSYFLPPLVSRTAGGCEESLRLVFVGRTGFAICGLLLFSIAWYSLYGICIQGDLERILLVSRVDGGISAPSAACIGRMGGLNRIEGVVECILPWIAALRLDKPLIGMTIALLVSYSLFVYNYMFPLWEV